MTVRSYSSAEAFKQALEQRLRSVTTSGGRFARKRQRLVFDRFLTRVIAVFGAAVTLKGGLVLELRLERARTTKDVDLRVVGSSEVILAKLQEAARLDFGDFMTFEVAPDAEHPEIQNDGLRYDGRVDVEPGVLARLLVERELRRAAPAYRTGSARSRRLPGRRGRPGRRFGTAPAIPDAA